MTQRSLSVRELALIEHINLTPPQNPEQAWARLKPEPYSLDALIAMMRSAFSTKNAHRNTSELAAQLKTRFEQHRIGEREALFWIHALTVPDLERAIINEAAFFAQLKALQVPTQEALKARFSVASVADVLLAPLLYALRLVWGMPDALSFGLEHIPLSQLLMPLLLIGAPNDQEHDEVAKVATSYIDALPLEMMINRSSYYRSTALYPLACLSGDQALVARVLELSCEVKFNDYYKLFAPLILALEDDDELIDYLWRVSTIFSAPQLGQLILRLGLDRLDVISRLVRSQRHRSQLKHFLPTLERVSSWRMVELLYDLSENQAAREWVNQRVEQPDAPLVLGLVRLAARRGKRRDFALSQLRAICAQAHGEALIRGVLPDEDAALIKLIEREVLTHEVCVDVELPDDAWPTWMSALMALEPDAEFEQDLKPCLEALPALLMDDQEHVVPAQVLTRMLYACMLVHRTRKRSEDKSTKIARARKKPEREAIAQLELMYDDLDARAASQWVWGLFMWWLEGDAEETQDWLMYMMAYLGDPIVATQLGQTLGKPRLFRGARQSAYIKIGLNVLSMMRLPTAWMMISQLEHKLKRSLKEHAGRLIMQIKSTYKINSDTFNDFIIPTFDLDAKGSRSFDYGPRSFALTIKNATTFGLIDSEGTTFKKLPPRRDSDDAACVARAKQEYKIVVKQLKQTFEAQRARLEVAMLTRRAWSARRWRQMLYEHPVMRHLCCGLVWASFEPEQEDAARLFLPTLDGELIDPDYTSLTLSDEHKVSLIHPMMISQAERTRWIELLTELEVIQPIDQLARACYVYEADHARYIDYALKAQRRTPGAVNRWRESGWRDYHYNQHYSYNDSWLTQFFISHNVIAHVDFDGDQFEEMSDLTPGVHYERGQAQLIFFKLGLNEKAEGLIPADELDPQLYSELLRFIVTHSPPPPT